MIAMSTTNELDGRVAIVTGASRNIGRAIALALADGGASIVVNARSTKTDADAVAREIEAKGGKALVHLADIANPVAVQGMVDATMTRFGRIDFLINNAALRAEDPLDRMTPARWREIMAISLDGQFYCVLACLPHLKKSGGGAIVNLGGLSAFTGSTARTHVVTAKAALIGLTRALATELAADKITVNLVSPGLIGPARAPGNEPAHHLTHGTLTGERGKPEDIAATVRFLCGPGARYITGQTLHVNGGAYFG
jgi:3-oxoacyl-[acyl-carrier protein] reductase